MVLKTKVVIALSGGVDSSVAAYMLQKQGFDVIGVTLKLFSCEIDDENGGIKCCGMGGIDAARATCNLLNIPYYVLDSQDLFKEKVLQLSYNSYLCGETPNPCAWCNKYLKFGYLWQFAQKIDAQYLATGHYAKIVAENNKKYLAKGISLAKDQSYFLYFLEPDDLNHIIFPLGDLEKTEVRQIASNLNLPAAKRPESQDICFALFSKLINNDSSGDIVNYSGKIIGKHKGYQFFTIGQRHGLSLRKGKPYHVIEIAPKQNQIIAETKEYLFRKFFWVELNKEIEDIDGEFNIKIRSRNSGADGRIIEVWGKKYVKVEFNDPQISITPGQIAVFYRNGVVSGGGKILSWKF